MFSFVKTTLLGGILAPSLTKDNIRYYLSKNPNYIFGSPALLELIKRNSFSWYNFYSSSILHIDS